MALVDDLKTESLKIFRSTWTERIGTVVPIPEDLKLGNDAVELREAAVLYADLDGSTNLVESKSWTYAAEIYKTYLYCAAKLVREEGGAITSYDGDRLMGIFMGSTPCNSATRCALKINYAVKAIINPTLKTIYPDVDYAVRHVVGIDFSKIRATRTGVRGDNDIVWVGRAPNFAAKLTTESSEWSTWITEVVFSRLEEKLKKSSGTDIWRNWTWTKMNNIPVYSSTYWHSL